MKMKRLLNTIIENNRTVGLAAATILLGIIILSIVTCEQKVLGTPEKITIAVAVQPISAPIYVAYEKGFFEREGLQVTFQSFSTGKDALGKVIEGKAHFCTVAETPLVIGAMREKRFYIVATMAESNKYMKIVARKDRGIEKTEDLIGKRVGVSIGTNAEYYLDALLTYNRIAKSRVQIVALKIEDMADALVRGDIDVAVGWSPYIARMQKLLGGNSVTLEDESIYKIYWNIVGAQDFVSTYPETVKKLLRALLRAENYIADNQKESSQIITRSIGAEESGLDNYNFYLRLDQSLLVLLEDEARWAIDKRLTEKSQVPNFMNMIDAKSMEAVDPQSVTLIHK